MICATTSSLLERGEELAALAAVMAAPPAFALVEGEPGIGKTRLLREALATAELGGRARLVGRAHPVRDPFPFGPLVSALVGAPLPPAGELSPLAGVLRGLLPERSAELPPAPPALGDPHAERHRSVRAFVELLEAIGPAVLVLDDLHWADERTVDFLGVLAADPPPRLSVVLSYRGEDVPEGSPLRHLLAHLPPGLVRARLALRPLSAAGVAGVAAGMLGVEALPETIGARLSEHTGGVPFVVEETVRLLFERGQLEEEWPAAVGVPPAVGEAIVERVGRLSPAARLAVEAAAVLGEPAVEERVARVAGLSRADAERGVAEAIAAGLLREEPHALSLRHALARQAVYGAIRRDRRRALHRAAAEALEAAPERSSVGQLVMHHREAGDHARWVHWARRAAATAASLGEDEVAFRYLRELLDSPAVPAPERPALIAELGWFARATKARLAGAADLLEEALEAGGSLAPALRGELRLLLGWHRIELPELAARGFDDIRAAAADLQERPALQARALSTLAIPWEPAATLGEHLGHLAAAERAAAREGDPVAAAAVAADRAWTLTVAGDPRARRAVEDLPEPSTPQIARQVTRALLNAANGFLDAGHHTLAREMTQRSRAVAAEHEVHSFEDGTRVIDLLVRWTLGELPGDEMPAPAGAHRPARISEELVRGEMLLARGALEEAHAPLTWVAGHAEALAHQGRGMRATAGLIRIARVRRDHERARRLAEAALAVPARKRLWLWSVALLPHAPLEALEPHLGALRAGLADRDAPAAAAGLHLLEGRLARAAGDSAGAAERFAAARKIAAAMPDPRLAARLAYAEGRARASLGDPAGGELLLEAWRELDRLGAPWEADAVRAAMRGLGLPAPQRRRGPRSYGDELSPRELEVARRAAAGATAREIAAELYLSPRTVEHHLANAMRKLGISSRRQLPDVL